MLTDFDYSQKAYQKGTFPLCERKSKKKGVPSHTLVLEIDLCSCVHVKMGSAWCKKLSELTCPRTAQSHHLGTGINFIKSIL